MICLKCGINQISIVHLFYGFLPPKVSVGFLLSVIHVCCVGAKNGFQMAPQSRIAVPQNVEALPNLATTVTVD